MLRRVSVLVVEVLLLVSVGCAPQRAYRGEPLPRDQVATVVGYGVTLTRVNGVEIASVATGAEIPPGRNEIEVLVNSSNYNARNDGTPVFKLTVNAQPGVQYAITGRRGDGRLCAWPIDPETGDPKFENPAGCLIRE